jgi:hypothetical protein
MPTHSSLTDLHPPFYVGTTEPTTVVLGYPLRQNFIWVDTNSSPAIYKRAGTVVDGEATEWIEDNVGPPGDDGAGLNYLSAWNSGASYVEQDVVTLDGSSYVAILPSTNQTPPNPTYWDVLAAKGDDASVADATHAATGKTTPVDADELPLADSAASFALKKLTWANLKATAKTYFDTLYAAITHTHAASDITSGTVAQARLGTGSGGAGTKFLADDQTYKTFTTGTGDVVGPGSSVASEVALFDGTTGKLIKRATGTGIAALTSGVLSASTAPTFSDFTNANHDHGDADDGGTLTHAAISDFDTQVRTSTLNQMTAPTADLSINSHKLTNVTDPGSNQDAATKKYVDDTFAGAGTGNVTGQASSVDSEVALFSSTTGKVIKRATGTGMALVTSGVLSLLGYARGSIVRGGASAWEALTVGATGQRLKTDGTDVSWGDDWVTLTFVIDGGGSAISTGIKGDLLIPDDYTIVSATALADQSGAIVVDIWQQTYASYPPLDAQSITASAPVTISASGVKSQDATLTGWDTTIDSGSTLRYNVDSCTSITRCSICLRCKKRS